MKNNPKLCFSTSGMDQSVLQHTQYIFKIDEGYDRNMELIELLCISEYWNNLFLYVVVIREEQYPVSKFIVSQIVVVKMLGKEQPNTLQIAGYYITKLFK